MEHVNYDRIAPTYDQRYAVRGLEGISSALLSLARDVGAEQILEVGCGTGYWLTKLQAAAPRLHGLDLSFGMLRQARQRETRLRLACGRASQLPFPDAACDLVFCVNAFHHFDLPQAFIGEARRLLRPGGAVGIIGMDPHNDRIVWYLYDYFQGAYESDLSRFPSAGTILEWLVAAGFASGEWREVERVVHHQVGREVLSDPFLQKYGTSQLALLTDEDYTAGLSRIEAALAEAEARGKRLVFPVDIPFTMVTGRVHESGAVWSRKHA